MNQERLTYLVQQYSTDQITPSELEELSRYINETEDGTDFGTVVASLIGQFQMADITEIHSYDEVVRKAHRIDMTDTPRETTAHKPAMVITKNNKFFLRKWGWVAASVIFVLGIGAYFLVNNKKSSDTTSVIKTTIDFAPGTNRAILTMGDKTIHLSNEKTGIAIGTAVTYNDGERIADASQTLQLATPRGGQYQAVLPDGSKVWLNAASSIRFPSKFNANKREVEVSGEVYMEVAQNPKAPFNVKTGNTTIQVLGTSFNINAYTDEEVQKTTLLSGSVKVLTLDDSRHARILTPGQQAVVAIAGNASKNIDHNRHYKQESITVRPANTDKVIAWKNGLFSFDGATLPEIMRQVERWYDIEVIYEKEIPQKEFEGEMTRDVTLNGLLIAFGKLGVRYKLAGRKLFILP